MLIRVSCLSGFSLLSLFTWIVVTPEGMQSQTAPSNPPAGKIDELFQQSASAYGGETKILSLQDGCFDYQVVTLGTAGAKPITVNACFKTDNFFRSEAKGDNLEAVTILNGDHGWVKVGDTILSLSRKEIEPVRIGMVVQLRPDLLLVSFPKRRYTGQIQEGGRTLELVEVSGFLAGEYVRGRLSFDLATHLIYRYEYETERESSSGKGVLKGEERYTRYEDKGGLKIPVEILSTQGSKTSRLSLKSVRFDPNLDPGLFQDPSGPSGDSPSGKK